MGSLDLYRQRWYQQALQGAMQENSHLGEQEGGGPAWDQAAFDAKWNQMTPEEQLAASGSRGSSGFGGWGLDANDPAIQQFVQQYGGYKNTGTELNNKPASGYIMGYGDPGLWGYGFHATGADAMVDPNRILRLPDGRWIMEQSNWRGDAVAGAQRQSPPWEKGPGPLMLAGVLGGAALGNAGLLGGGSSSGGFFDALGTGEGFGASPAVGATGGSGGGFFDALGGGEGFGGAAPSEGLLSPPGGGLTFGPEGAIDPETAAGAGGMGVGQNGIGPGSLGQRFLGAVNNPSSLLSGNGLLANAGSWVLSNPLQALGVAQMAGGLLGRATNRGTTGGSSGGSTKGGTGNGPKVSRGTWSPNPVTARQIANFRFTGG